MKIIYKAGSRKTFAEMNGETQQAVRRAVELV